MIPEINNILYASDLGDSSRPAFLMAAKEAFKHGAKITFLHVIEPTGSSTESMLSNYLEEGDFREMRQQGIEIIKQRMEARVDQFCKEDLRDRLPLQQRPQTRIEEGRSAETIIRVADEINADLIIMGSRSRSHSALGRFFVGSTAQSVMQLSTRPVMVIPLKG